MKINGSIIGRVNTTTTQGAKGIFSSQEVYYARLGNSWPLFTGFIEAYGGNITFADNFKIHTFFNTGIFTVSEVPIEANVEVLLVAGGGSGSTQYGGGGGGGGFVG